MMIRMENQRGVTLVELVVVVALVAIMLVAVMGYSVPWMAKQSMRGAVHDVHTFLQLTRIEAVSRNRPCRFVVDTAGGEFQILDSLGTSSLADDLELHRSRLPETVGFDRPDSGGVVTLQAIDAVHFQTVFDSDGTVTSGAGDLFFHGSGSYGRIGVHVAGGTEISRWDGADWQAGS